MKGVLWFVLIGLIAGWLAGLIMKGRGFGLIGDILVGVIGAVFGGWLFGVLGLTAYDFSGALMTATVGAVALLSLIMIVKRV